MTKVTFEVTNTTGSKFESSKTFENAQDVDTFFRFAKDAQAQGYSFKVVSVETDRN